MTFQKGGFMKFSYVVNHLEKSHNIALTSIDDLKVVLETGAEVYEALEDAITAFLGNFEKDGVFMIALRSLNITGWHGVMLAHPLTEYNEKELNTHIKTGRGNFTVADYEFMERLLRKWIKDTFEMVIKGVEV